jgi:hypothetical protein
MDVPCTQVRNGQSGLLVVGNLQYDTSVNELKELLIERLMLKPGRAIRLYSWGRELADDAMLQHYSLLTNAQLDMTVTLCRIPPDRGACPSRPRRPRVPCV